MTTVLGIDPGSRITGYGIIHDYKGIQCAIDYGIIRVQGTSLCEKLGFIKQELENIVQKQPIDTLAVESIFFAKNPQSALKLGQARGAAICAIAKYNPDFFEYSAREVKLSVVGYGNASKDQMQHMVKALLKLQQAPKPDAADALAVALCHCHQQRLAHTLSRSQITAGDGS